MKTTKIANFKTDRAFKSMIKIFLISSFIMLLFLLIFDNIFNDSFSNTVKDFDITIWVLLQRYKWQIVLIIYIIVVNLTSFFVIKTDNSYMDKLFTSMESIIDNPAEKIDLPKNLELLETELNKIRLNLVESQEKAKEEENKKNDLILYMAHDLKTPLTSVIGYLNLLKEENQISEKTKDKYISIALNKALRVEELTNQFFEITRYNLHEMTLNKSIIDLNLLLNQLIEESLPILLEKNLKIKLNSNKKIMFNGDGDLLARAFGNLIKNAINYSHSNTTIEIDIEECEDVIKLQFQNEGDKIPPYKLEKIFEKFYRADDSRNSTSGGVGLGLSITKEIIELHDGTIEVSNEDKYIVFNIILMK